MRKMKRSTFLELEKKNTNYDIKDCLGLRLRRNILDKAIMLRKQKKKDDHNPNQRRSDRFLITINVVGSAGPLRFVVKEDDSAANVIEAALSLYARQERLPILGSDIDSFCLYPVNAGFDVLEASEEIGSRGTRNFVLCKKLSHRRMTETKSSVVNGKGSRWRRWFQKSLSIKNPPH